MRGLGYCMMARGVGDEQCETGECETGEVWVRGSG